MQNSIFCRNDSRFDVNINTIRIFQSVIQLSNRLDTYTYKQATGIGGVGGIFGIPPLAEIFSKIPAPWRFWVKPPFCFLNERKNLKFTLI